jgi:hypothetical protein
MPSALHAVVDRELAEGQPSLRTDKGLFTSVLHTSPVKLMQQCDPRLASGTPDWYSTALHLQYCNHAAVGPTHSPAIPSEMNRFAGLNAEIPFSRDGGFWVVACHVV